ncbi:MAG: porin [Betaproteobacteria bacterium]|nr:porin [Betaproteobacteria bacterium]
MQKKLLAVAVAGALALPGVASAASSVTITGFFKMSYAYIKLGDFTGTGSSSEDRVQDESSRIYFRVVEDLGGGLQAIGQVDWRIALDSAVSGASGANWVGLRSKSWGQVTIGRHDLHYIYTEDQSYSRGGSLKGTNTSIIAYSAAGNFAIANATRTPNTIVWDSPNWKGFNLKVAYSTNPYAASEADIGSNAPDGYAWNIAPQYNAKNWGIGYSYWTGKNDGYTITRSWSGTTINGAQIKTTGNRINAHYQWGGFRVGVVWDQSKIKLNGTVVPLVNPPSTLSKRDAWSIPLRYDWGKWSVFGHYSWAQNDKGDIASLNGLNTKAKMWTIGGAYALSKRTKLALEYAQIKNKENAQYNLFTSAAGSLGSPDAAVAPGEDPKQIALTVTHNF